MNNQYHFVTQWRIAAPPDRIFDLIQKPLDFPKWWGSVYLAAEPEPGDRIRFVTKGKLPYRLRWSSEMIDSHPPKRLAIKATGDFDGRGIWTLEPNGDCTLVKFDWRLTAEKPLLRFWSFLLKPIFEWNHRWAMEQGRSALEKQLNHANLPADSNLLRSFVQEAHDKDHRKQVKMHKNKSLPAAALALSTYSEAALRALPGSQLREIRLGGGAQKGVTLRLWLPGDLRSEGNNRVSVDSQTARILSVDKASDWAGAKRFTEALTPIHYVEWGGLPLKIVWSLFGLTPTFLFCTGIPIWWRPSQFRWKAERAKKKTDEVLVATS